MDFEGLYAASGSKPTIDFISFSVVSAISPGRLGRLFTRSVAAITTCSRSLRIFCRCSSTSFIAFSLSNDAIDSSRSKSWRCCLVKRLGTLLLLPRRLPPPLPPLLPPRPPRRSRCSLGSSRRSRCSLFSLFSRGYSCFSLLSR